MCKQKHKLTGNCEEEKSAKKKACLLTPKSSMKRQNDDKVEPKAKRNCLNAKVQHPRRQQWYQTVWLYKYHVMDSVKLATFSMYLLKGNMAQEVAAVIHH